MCLLRKKALLALLNLTILAAMAFGVTEFSYGEDEMVKEKKTAKLTVVVPENAQKAYGIAGKTFCNYWEKITDILATSLSPFY